MAKGLVISLIRAYPGRICLGLLLFWFSGMAVNGQNNYLSFHHLTQERGLTYAAQYHISKDSRGFVWIGTEEGLLRFDGRQLLRYQHDEKNPASMAENRITSKCFEDRDGNLWFTTTNGIHCYLRRRDRFLFFTHPSLNLKSYHAFHLEDNGKMWLSIGAGKDKALYYFHTRTKSFDLGFSLEGEVFTVVRDKTGQAAGLVATALPSAHPYGLIFNDLATGTQKGARFLYLPDGRTRRQASPTKGVWQDHDGTLWAGIYNGLGRFHPGQPEGLVEEQRSGQVDDEFGWVWDIAEYDSTRLLVAATKGLLIFDRQKRAFVQQFRYQATNRFSLKVKNINRMALDSSGTVWVAGDQQEIAFASLQKNKFFPLTETLGSSVISMAEDPEGNFWCSTLDSGTFIFNSNRELIQRTLLLNNFDRKAYSPLHYFNFFLTKGPGDWWSNMGNNFFWWNRGTREFEFRRAYFLGLNSIDQDRVNYCYRLADGRTIAAQGNRLIELILQRDTVIRNTDFGDPFGYLQLSSVTALFQDQRGQLYIGDDSERLVILKQRGDQFVKTADLVKLGSSYSFLEDPARKVVWAATSKGLVKIDPNTFEVRHYGQESDSIASEGYYDLALDKQGGLWLTGNNGLIRYHPDTKDFHRFNQSDGLLSQGFNKNTCVAVASTGEIWVGGKNGANVFHPMEVRLLDLKPSVKLTGLWINDEPYGEGENIAEINTIRRRFSENTLSFEFAALDFSDPAANQYFYQLEGLEKERVANGNQGFVRFANLPAGDYRFKVWATNSDGILNETPAVLAVQIIPPFVQTGWFYLLCFLLATGVVYLVFRYRLAQALKVEQLRVKISSDLHDDVGAMLSGLAMQTEILELTAQETIKPQLRRIAAISRSAMSRMRDTVWAIDARKDKLENLRDRLREHAEETLTPKNIRCNISIHGLDLKKNLPVDIRQHLFLICKEALTNVARHSDADQVEVELNRSGKFFSLLIEDNGTFVPKSFASTGLGLSNIKLRAERLGAELYISTENGFRIKLQMKAF